MNIRQVYLEECGRYRRKCREHLHRAKLTCLLALDELRPQTSGLSGSGYEKLAGQCVSDPKKNLKDKISSTVTSSQFLLLKVNFEYFLNRIITHCWKTYFTEVGQAVREQKRLHVYVKACRRNEPDYTPQNDGVLVTRLINRETLLERAIPQHDLDELNQCLFDVTKRSLENCIAGWQWPQIFWAFKVRHLIEHTNGKVDDRFLKSLNEWKPLTRKCSWHDSLRGIKVGDKVPIRKEDFDKTYDAMLYAVDAVTKVMEEYNPTPSSP